MNKQTKALKMNTTQAIDFLYAVTMNYTLNSIDHDRFEKAVDVLAKALEQPAQEPVAWMMVNREPDTDAAYLTFEKPTREQKISHHPQELYTHPAPSWQGLSDDEADDIWNKAIAKGFGSRDFVLRFARAIENALKEKNHG